ncbi:MAG: HAMP domain-containing sensor histidine kinase [Actinomycetota bacterium]
MLLVPLVASLALGSAGLGVFVHRAVERDQIAGLDDELTRALRVTLSSPSAGVGPGARPGRGPGQNPQASGTAPDADQTDSPQELVLDRSGEVQASTGNAADLLGRDLGPLVGETVTTTLDGSPRLRVTTVARSDGTTAVIALPLDEVDASLAALRRSLFIGTGVLIAVQALIASVVVGRINRPISRLSATAHRIAEGDLDADIGPPSGPREAALLTEDLSAMVDRLRSTIAGREEAAARADRARADMEQFMADASHELRTPLTAIQGFSELYEAGMLDDDGVDRAMQRIGSESRRLTDLVNDLLRLLRPSDTRHMERVDMAAVASAVAHDVRAAFAGHTIAVEFDAADAGACSALGDPARLHQAVLNLVANACQHTPDGTSVLVGVRSAMEDDRRLVEIRVTDDGPGIDPAVARSLFEPFVRAERSRRRRSNDGAGLGLTITRRIVEQHGGRIEVAETPGGGATFVLGLVPWNASAAEHASTDGHD